MSDFNEKGIELPRKIMLVESSSVVRKLFAQNLELYAGAEVHFFADADAVIDKLNRNDEEYNLIITENMVGEENTSLKIFYTVNSQKLNIPIILLGKNPKISKDVTEIEKEEWRKVVKEAARLMEVNAQQMFELEVPELYPISTYSILFDFYTPTDIWIKEKGEHSVWKSSGDKVTLQEARSLILKSQKNIYIDSLYRLSFTDFISEALIKMMNDNSYSSKERINATGVAFSNTIDSLKNIGFSEKNVESTKEIIKSMSTVATTTDGLDDLLSILQDSTESFLYKHSLMICAIASNCLQHLEWGTEDQIKNICFAAFFHDITIPEDHLCQIHERTELNDKELGVEDLERVDKHALEASELISNFPEVAFGVDQLILQHHGSLNGLGFSKTDALDNRLSPLAIVFIVVESFVHHLLKNENTEVKPAIFIKVLESRFTKGKEKKVLDAIAKSFFEKK
ncbi:MAG: hypothetical protein GY909_10705 [Oligoflexia bacterium]|nr:hypothetical protein [Oligoflexia bacterium]